MTWAMLGSLNWNAKVPLVASESHYPFFIGTVLFSIGLFGNLSICLVNVWMAATTCKHSEKWSTLFRQLCTDPPAAQEISQTWGAEDTGDLELGVAASSVVFFLQLFPKIKELMCWPRFKTDKAVNEAYKPSISAWRSLFVHDGTDALMYLQMEEVYRGWEKSYEYYLMM